MKMRKRLLGSMLTFGIALSMVPGTGLTVRAEGEPQTETQTLHAEDSSTWKQIIETINTVDGKIKESVAPKLEKLKEKYKVVSAAVKADLHELSENAQEELKTTGAKAKELLENGKAKIENINTAVDAYAAEYRKAVGEQLDALHKQYEEYKEDILQLPANVKNTLLATQAKAEELFDNAIKEAKENRDAKIRDLNSAIKKIADDLSKVKAAKFAELKQKYEELAAAKAKADTLHKKVDPVVRTALKEAKAILKNRVASVKELDTALADLAKAWTSAKIQKMVEGSKISITSAAVSYKASMPYTGRDIAQKLTVKVDDVVLTEGEDYGVSYTNNVKVGTATMKIVGLGKYTDSIEKTFKIVKQTNPVVVVGKNVTMSINKLNASETDGLTFKRKTTLSIKEAKGALSYELVSVSPSSKASYFSINPTSGGIHVKKGLKLGTYKLKVKVKDAGNASYKAAEKTVTVQVKLYKN